MFKGKHIVWGIVFYTVCSFLYFGNYCIYPKYLDTLLVYIVCLGLYITILSVHSDILIQNQNECPLSFSIIEALITTTADDFEYPHTIEKKDSYEDIVNASVRPSVLLRRYLLLNHWAEFKQAYSYLMVLLFNPR